MWIVTCEMVRGVLEYYVEHKETGERKGTFDCEKWAQEFANELNKEGDGMSRIDASIHKLYRAMKANDIKWNDFPSIGLCESYYLWYYAEDRLYMVKDCMTDMIYLVEARSPTEAFGVLASRIDEAMRAGDLYDEEVTE